MDANCDLTPGWRHRTERQHSHNVSPRFRCQLTDEYCHAFTSSEMLPVPQEMSMEMFCFCEESRKSDLCFK